MKPSDEDKAIHAPPAPGALHLGLEILVSEEDNSVYVKFLYFFNLITNCSVLLTVFRLIKNLI